MVCASAQPEKEKEKEKVYYPEGFVPTKDHVVCGRGKKAYGHIGNQHFLTIVAGRVNEYAKAETKAEKTEILEKLVAEVNTKGGFVRLDEATGRYYQADEGKEKTSQYLRDCLNTKYRSSKDIKRTNRKKKRLARQASKERILGTQGRRGSMGSTAPVDPSALGRVRQQRRRSSCGGGPGILPDSPFSMRPRIVSEDVQFPKLQRRPSAPLATAMDPKPNPTGSNPMPGRIVQKFGRRASASSYFTAGTTDNFAPSAYDESRLQQLGLSEHSSSHHHHHYNNNSSNNINNSSSNHLDGSGNDANVDINALGYNTNNADLGYNDDTLGYNTGTVDVSALGYNEDNVAPSQGVGNFWQARRFSASSYGSASSYWSGTDYSGVQSDNEDDWIEGLDFGLDDKEEEQDGMVLLEDFEALKMFPVDDNPNPHNMAAVPSMSAMDSNNNSNTQCVGHDHRNSNSVPPGQVVSNPHTMGMIGKNNNTVGPLQAPPNLLGLQQQTPPNPPSPMLQSHNFSPGTVPARTQSSHGSPSGVKVLDNSNTDGLTAEQMEMRRLMAQNIAATLGSMQNPQQQSPDNCQSASFRQQQFRQRSTSYSSHGSVASSYWSNDDEAY